MTPNDFDAIDAEDRHLERVRPSGVAPRSAVSSISIFA
jgi:hypothetical protein